MSISAKRSQGAGNASYTPAAISNNSAPGSGHLDYDDSPFLDSFIDGEGDESFDFEDQGQMFGDLPDDNSDDNGTADPDHLHDKRKSMGAEDDDDHEGGGKRREGEDKQAKKPGRKPLTSEPTSKRKAQNRAAQRAFRERKEKHLKDLEVKVEDLEKASETANQENGVLRAQVERLQVELKEYRKRLSWISSNGGARQQPTSNNSRPTNLGNGSSDFQFQFPKFGDSPNTSIFGSTNNQKPTPPPARAPARTSSVPTQQTASPASSSVSRHSISNAMQNMQNSRHNSVGNSPRNNNITASPPSYNSQTNGSSVDSLTGLFSPSILEATRNSPHGYFGIGNNQNKPTNRGSFENSYSSVPGLYSGSSVSNTESPGSCSDAQNQLSSIGTSPDPNFNSPHNKLQDYSMNTINEEGNLGQWNFDTNGAPEFDPTGFSWLAQQNGGGFDPVLFGDYRDTTDNILSQDFGSFFNDAYPLPELGSPSHNYGDVSGVASNEQAKKTDLLSRVDAAHAGDITVPSSAPKLMTCNKIWDRLQSMEKFRNGEIDIDNLCSELRAKAKCSEGGAVVEEKHVNRILGL
ncbi:DNA-binding transcription factor yap1 [Knufia fluminis]|uniref:DNA-binding transcription factor yap1 n=1 Tax=Knufia fluminis TaxID=191047 RepID=A0AAN8IBC7_9EURO|nr:DNA-binding transcription factor yap1 [Knufia fluminis]